MKQQNKITASYCRLSCDDESANYSSSIKRLEDVSLAPVFHVWPQFFRQFANHKALGAVDIVNGLEKTGLKIYS